MIPIGEHIKLVLAIDGRVATVAAEVARHERLADGRDAVGVAFRGIPDRLADQIEQAVMMTLERQQAALVAR